MTDGIQKRILVVDDDAEIRTYMRFILTRQGYDVCECGDGDEVAGALERFGDPDLVITDVHMPRRDGIETLIALRENRPQTRVIVMSGAEDKQTVLQVADIFNADGIIEKPFTGDVLITLVRDALQANKSGMESV